MWGLLLILVFGASWFIQWRLKSKFEEYSRVPLQGGLSGEDVANKMLRDNGIYDVKVVSVEGRLTDHYNPLDKTVNLSPEVFSGRSVASAAIAAHECGHAVQHADAYQWLDLRSKIVPTVSFMGKWVPWVLMGGAVLAFASPYLGLAVIALGIVFYGAMSIFSLITLPVEFDASARGLHWLESTGITAGSQHDMAKDALKWAALTYVVSAVGMIVNLLYYIQLFTGRSRN